VEVLGVAIRGYFVQYRFILPENIKHSSYTYQKLFRAIYGYNQAVHKGSGKRYIYHRAGILSNYPYIRPGKNCVIIPQNAFQTLQDFFKTGHNPTHNWETKGEWKCTYFLNEKDISEAQVIKSLQDLISRRYIKGIEGLVSLSSEMKRVSVGEVDSTYKLSILKEVQDIVDLEWFKQVYSQSPELSEFYNNYKLLKGISPQNNPSSQ
jgi:hypothetical protein